MTPLYEAAVRLSTPRSTVPNGKPGMNDVLRLSGKGPKRTLLETTEVAEYDFIGNRMQAGAESSRQTAVSHVPVFPYSSSSA